ncbi:hypothetical protein BDW72DRAFT_169986 [Aspergillus terricola var. indicus]
MRSPIKYKRYCFIVSTLWRRDSGERFTADLVVVLYIVSVAMRIPIPFGNMYDELYACVPPDPSAQICPIHASTCLSFCTDSTRSCRSPAGSRSIPGLFSCSSTVTPNIDHYTDRPQLFLS